MIDKNISLNSYIDRINKINVGFFRRIEEFANTEKELIVEIHKKQKLGYKKVFYIMVYDSTGNKRLLYRTIYIDTEVTVYYFEVKLKSAKLELNRFKREHRIDDKYIFFQRELSKRYNELNEAVKKCEKEELASRGLNELEQIELMIRTLSTLYTMELIIQPFEKTELYRLTLKK
ncbi:hypothetical protein ABNR98_004457 [Salmonella enterica]